MLDSDSLNAISLHLSIVVVPWRFQFYFNELKALSSSIRVEFRHVRRIGNGFVDVFAKEGVNRCLVFVVFLSLLFWQNAFIPLCSSFWLVQGCFLCNFFIINIFYCYLSKKKEKNVADVVYFATLVLTMVDGTEKLIFCI